MKSVVQCIILLPSDALSEKYKEFWIKDLMMNPNIDSLDSLMPNLYILQSDNITKKARSKRERG